MKVVWQPNSQSDFLELGPTDFKKADVETRRHVKFQAGVPTEVDDELAALLVDEDGVFAGFPITQVEDDEETDEDEGSRDVDDDGEGKDEADLGKADSSNSTSDGSGSTGAGTSTAASTGGRGSRSTRSSRT